MTPPSPQAKPAIPKVSGQSVPKWFDAQVPPDRRSARSVAETDAPPPLVDSGLGDAAAASADRRAPSAGGGQASGQRASNAAMHRRARPESAPSRPAEPLTPEASFRIYRLFVVARAALGSAMAAGQLVAGVLGAWAPPMVLGLVLLQASAALLAWVLPPGVPQGLRDPRSWRGLRRQAWWFTIGLDLLCFSGLHLLSSGTGPNYGALLVLPVLMAGVFMPRAAAFGVAAAVTLLLLSTAAWWQTGVGEVSASLAQAGLAGMGLMLASWLASELTARLQREEAAARGSQERARQEAQLNRLVIDEMRDGVMVVDRQGWVRRANPAARALIAATGGGPEPPFQLRGVVAWQALTECVEQGYAQGISPGVAPESAHEAVLAFEPGYRRTLKLRPRFTRRRGSSERDGEELCVLFLEDMRDVQARSRQERLAAMGRVSAGIAHEIRNPLAAIAQANALLLEDAADASQRRLAQMVDDNVIRLKRIVDDVLNVAPGGSEEVVQVDARALLEAVCADWARTNAGVIGSDAVLVLELPYADTPVVFDPEHLRRVIVNLLDNAHRHATRQPGSVRVRLYEASATHVALLVANDGAAIAPDVEPHLFEPFFSTRSRGTGLGLYICRELCQRHAARIDYRQRASAEGHRNEFHVLMQRAPAAVPHPSSG